MDNTEEKRLCKKCGKRLPSSNNFCMYCGCNNNISDEELAALQTTTDKNLHSQSKQELLNKSIAAKDRPLNIEKGASDSPSKKRPPEEKGNLPLITKLIYVFMLLVIVVMSTVLVFNTKNMFFNNFKYDLDKYDKFVSYNNNTFIGLKDNKIEIIGEKTGFNKKDFEKIDKINKQRVLDIGIFYGSSDDNVYIKTNKGLYDITSYGSIDVERLDEPKDNLLEDINVELKNNVTLDGKYYSIVDDNSYFIKDGSLYKNVLVERYHYEKGKGMYNIYTSEKVIDASELDMTNPRIVDSSTSNDSIVILGDDIIKAYIKGVLVSSIDRFTIGKEEYKISDFKYIFYHDGDVSLVDKSNRLFEKDIGEYLNTRTYTSYGFYSRDTKTVKEASEQDLNQNINIYRSGTHNSLYYLFFPLKDNYKAILILLGILILIVGVMYFCKEKPFLISFGLLSGTILVIIILYFVYYLTQQTQSVKIGEIIKAFIGFAPEVLLVGFITTIIKEIAAYISEKLNIETIYHFTLIAISLIISLIAFTEVTDEPFISVVVIGIIWTFICYNDEDYVNNNMNIIKLIPVLGILVGSIVLTFILSNMLGIANYYFYIIIIAFCFAYYLVLNDSITIGNSMFKMLKGNSVIIMGVVSIIMTFGIEFLNTLGEDNEYQRKFAMEIVGILIKYGFSLIAFILVIGSIIGILLFAISKAGVLLNKIDNRILKVFIYFVIMIVFVSLIIYLIPQIENVFYYILKLLFKTNAKDPTSLFLSSFGI